MGQPWNRNENGVESFRFSGEKMETERNQHFVSLDRAIEQNQRLNHVCHFHVSPSSMLDPTRSLGMPLTANRVYDNFPACLSMDRAMEY